MSLARFAAAWLAVVGVCVGLGATAAERSAGPEPMRAPQAAGVRDALAPALSATQLMDWAERSYPALFPTAGKSSGYSAPYSFRYYPQTQNYLGVSTGSSADVAIYLLGPASGGKVQRIGPLVDYTCTVLPGSCTVIADPGSLSLKVVEGTSLQSDLVFTLPALPGNASAQVDQGGSSSWLSVSSKDGQGGYVVYLSAFGMTPGTTRNGAVLVTFSPNGGKPATTLRVPVTMNVVAGLIAPSAQLKTLDSTTTLAAQAGSVAVVRGDERSSTWTAQSSAPWLVLSATTGTTPASLGFAMDATAVAALDNFAEHTATVTLAVSGLKSVSFPVTLRKRLPYLGAALPYGIPAGVTSRVTVGGGGFLQYANMASSLRVAGQIISKLSVLSDSLLSFEVSPTSVGAYAVTLAKATDPLRGPVKLQVTAADAYVPSVAIHSGDASVYNWVHDPVRQAIYAASWKGNALYRYQYLNGQWTVTALPVTGAYGLGMIPDGRLLVTTTSGAIKLVDTSSFKVLTTINSSVKESNLYAPIATSANGRVWLPDGSAFDRMSYFDLVDENIRQLRLGKLASPGAFIGSGDGAMVLVSPQYCCSDHQWHRYLVRDGSIGEPMGQTEFWYDPRFSTDGSRLLKQSGELYDEAFELLGQVPATSSQEFWAEMALTPDGKKIIALARPNNNNYSGAMPHLDVFSTAELTPGTTRFLKTGSIALSELSAACGSQDDVCHASGSLMVSNDNRTVFWAGNKRVQAFRIP